MTTTLSPEPSPLTDTDLAEIEARITKADNELPCACECVSDRSPAWCGVAFDIIDDAERLVGEVRRWRAVAWALMHTGLLRSRMEPPTDALVDRYLAEWYAEEAVSPRPLTAHPPPSLR